jgi:hypothetical protein
MGWPPFVTNFMVSAPLALSKCRVSVEVVVEPILAVIFAKLTDHIPVSR